MLRQVTLRTTLFNKILSTYESYTEYCPYISDIIKFGLKNKQIIYYNQDELITTENRLHYLGIIKADDEYTEWKQVIVRKDETATENYVKPDISGTYSLLIVNKHLYNYYKKEEVKAILESYKTDYDFNKKQQHYLLCREGLHVYHNCTGYDINGAHNDALAEMFPRAAEYFIKLFAERHDKPDNKKIVNYYCGMLNTKDKDGNSLYYPGAYNWIVQRTTAKLLAGINQVQGPESLVIYENTDGFIIQNSEKALENSAKLGSYKIEMTGDLYIYKDKNYWCMQYIDSHGKTVLKGNLLNSVRDKVNLFEGKVVHYDKVKNQFSQMIAINVTEDTIKEVEYHD